MTAPIPIDILSEIEREAREQWPDDDEMQRDRIETETEAYRSLHALDFGDALQQKDALLRDAEQYYSGWEETLDFVSGEIDAFRTLAALAPEDLPAEFVAEQKRKAAKEEDWFSIQLDQVTQAIEGHRYIQRTRAKVGPMRDLLVAMEAIIGAECYNANIQNYGPGGIWEGEGRSFRYPVTYIRDEQDVKCWGSVDDLPPEVLITGRYKFGANELGINRALVRIVDMLRDDYGLDLARKVGGEPPTA